jgi:hypothetical protein
MIRARHARSTALGLAAIAALAFAGAGTTQGAPAIPLNTGQETPAPTVGGAHGFFSYEIDGKELCYTLEVTGLSSPAISAHIHFGPRHVAGPVVPLEVENATSFEVSACSTASPAVLAQIEESPKSYYVNVHTSTNQPGEIRGQLK